MKKILASFIVFTMTSVSAFAGGILTNTNQSIDFLRNPARDAAIGLDGVYSNPAGVVFLPEGFHLGHQLAVCSPDTYYHFNQSSLPAWKKKQPVKSCQDI